MKRDCPRRHFLKAFGCAATSLFTGNTPGANRRINLAFIGTGSAGVYNMACSTTARGFQVTHLCDNDPHVLAAAGEQARRFGWREIETHCDYREILADKAIDAVCISAPAGRSRMIVEACEAGKDVYVEPPRFLLPEEGTRVVEAARKHKRIVQAGTVARSGPLFQKAREIVRSGQLGEISFCRASSARMLDLVQFAFDDIMPRRVMPKHTAADDALTYSYPTFLLSIERQSTYDAVSFHGSRATLAATRAGYRVFPTDVEETRCDITQNGPAHWRNWMECIRTRRKPSSDIETCVREASIWMLTRLALREA